MKKLLTASLAALMIFCGCDPGIAGSSANNGTPLSAALLSAGSYTDEDLTVLQDLLLCRRATTNGKNFDLNNDGKLDVFDMCLLRKAVSAARDEGAVRDTFNIAANGTVFTARFADNSSADAFRELLKKGDLTIDMHDYGSFEKVGSLGTSLPRNDEKITTVPGDVILYQGTSITVYYDKNTWDFTRLGKIENVTKAQLLAAFGSDDVEITFSINND